MITSTPEKVKAIQAKIYSSGLFNRIARTNPHPEIFGLLIGGNFQEVIEKLREKEDTVAMAEELKKLVDSTK